MKLAYYMIAAVTMWTFIPRVFSQSITTDQTYYEVDASGTAWVDNFPADPAEPSDISACDCPDQGVTFSGTDNYTFSWYGDTTGDTSGATVDLDTSTVSESTGDKYVGVTLYPDFMCNDGSGDIQGDGIDLPEAYFTVYKINSKAENSAPDGTPDDRTTIGIGEYIDVSISPSSITNVTWSVDGQGSVSDVNGNTTTYSATGDPSSETVNVTFDSGDVGSIDYNIVAPTSLYIESWSDNSSPPGVDGPPNKYIGAQTYFFNQILPASVSFVGLTFRENIPAGSNAYTWNDGTARSGPSGQFEAEVDENNVYPDDNIMGPIPIERLIGAGIEGGTYQDDNIAFTTPLEYFDAIGNWISFDPDETHNFYYSGSDQSCVFEEVDTNSVDGESEGPYKDGVTWTDPPPITYPPLGTGAGGKK